MAKSVTVKAPSSTANLGPGFDVFGLALDAFFDEIKIAKKKEKGITIKSADGTPTNPQKNPTNPTMQNKNALLAQSINQAASTALQAAKLRQEIKESQHIVG